MVVFIHTGARQLISFVEEAEREEVLKWLKIVTESKKVRDREHSLFLVHHQEQAGRTTLQDRWSPWSPEMFTYWMWVRVMARMNREVMSPERRQAYEQRSRILGATLAALEVDHSLAARQRAHDFCFNVTDLSPRSNSPDIEWGTEALPVDGVSEDEHMTEENGYFEGSTLPGRNFGGEGAASASAEVPNRETREDGEEQEEEEDEQYFSDHETRDEKFRRYMRDPLEECSDPDFWMTLHDGESSSSENIFSEG